MASFLVVGTVLVSGTVNAEDEDSAWELFEEEVKKLKSKLDHADISGFEIDSVDMDEISEDA